MSRARIRSLVRTLLLVLFATPLVPRESARAQGAAFLLIPVGARGVGTGEAAVADTLGADGVWWNPASLAAMGKSEISLNGAQTFDGNGASITYARPSQILGTIALTANIFDYGDQGNTAESGDLGTISIRHNILMASYATAVGSRLRVGLNYKFARFAFTCSGVCGETSQFSGSTGALDVGAQYVLPTKLPITIGGAIKHLGPQFQLKDAEQADPLPRTWQIGASTRVPSSTLDSAGFVLDVMADALGGVAYEKVSLRFGTVVTYQSKYSLRGGYTLVDTEGGGPTLGVGVYLSDGMVVDIATRFGDLAATVGQPATYVTLRFLF